MSCPDGKHDLRAVNPFVHPSERDARGQPIEVVGAPPQSEEEPAWCRICGAVWGKKPFGLGWGFMHPMADSDAPTLGNLIREARERGGSDARTRVGHVDQIVKSLLDTAARLDAGEERGGLTGVALVVEGGAGVFRQTGPMTGVWTSMQGGDGLAIGLRGAIADVEALRAAKKERVQ